MARYNSQRQVDFGGNYEAVLAGETLEAIHAYEVDALAEAAGRSRKTTIYDQERHHAGAIVHRASSRASSAREIGIVAILDHYRPRPTIDVVVRELGRVEPGWAGEDSVAPSTRVLRDIRSVSVCLPQFIKMPEVEIEPDDGSVILRWTDDAATASFSLSFHGKGEVIGFLSATNDAKPAWKCKVDSFSVLAVRTSDEKIRSLLAQ
ncbi:hypothetical protein ELH51_27315 [Rhizobium ruizarguesonis]|uniref:hypothetical protein n=1 Tax=Rhizobium ruizarguesonis TaxID=2081791 RepID=UPI001030B612|nr:hypothetical protein [Rhizobium ruizarguesonis]TBB25193.1 hypothetical protein ELH51_27315 [Rhizobium ruizarguesonis]